MLFIFLHKNKDLKKDTLGEFLEVSFFNSVIIQSNQASSGADDFIRRTFSKGKGEKYGESYICRKAERGFK